MSIWAPALVLFLVLTATIVLLTELRAGSSTLRVVVLSSACIVFPVIGFVGWAVFRAWERQKELKQHQPRR